MQDIADFRFRWNSFARSTCRPTLSALPSATDSFFCLMISARKNLLITPEEWVRQHFVQFLVGQKKYPKSLIQLEGGLKLNGQSKRSDILIFNTSAEKILLVECKAPSV